LEASQGKRAKNENKQLLATSRDGNRSTFVFTSTEKTMYMTKMIGKLRSFRIILDLIINHVCDFEQ